MKLTKSQVHKLGFSDSMINKMLPPPEIVPNPEYWRIGGVFKLWNESDVTAVMQTAEFKLESNLFKISKVGNAIAYREQKLEKMKKESNCDAEIKKLTSELAQLYNKRKSLQRNHKQL